MTPHIYWVAYVCQLAWEIQRRTETLPSWRFLRNKLTYWEKRQQLKSFSIIKNNPSPFIRCFYYCHFTGSYVFWSLCIARWRTEMYRLSHHRQAFSIYQSLSDFILKAMHWDDFKIDRKNCLRDSNKNESIRIHCDYGLLRMV